MRLFNAGAFHACHDVLEDLWRAEARPFRDVYKGVLQVGVAYWHAERGNLRGGRRLALRGVSHLEPFLPEGLGLDLATLVAGARAAADCWGMMEARPFEGCSAIPDGHIGEGTAGKD